MKEKDRIIIKDKRFWRVQADGSLQQIVRGTNMTTFFSCVAKRKENQESERRSK